MRYNKIDYLIQDIVMTHVIVPSIFPPDVQAGIKAYHHHQACEATNLANLTEIEGEFFYAILDDNKDAIERFIDNGFDIQCYDNQAVTLACKKSKWDIAKFLITQGADLHAQEDSPFNYAIVSKNNNMIKFLCERFAHVTRWMLMTCIKHEQEALFSNLTQTLTLSLTQEDLEACFLAATIFRSSQIEFYGKFFLTQGVDVNCKDGSLLIFACEFSNLDVVKYLIEHGANVSINDNKAMRTATAKNHVGMIDLLIEHGADESIAKTSKNNAVQAFFLERHLKHTLAQRETNKQRKI